MDSESNRKEEIAKYDQIKKNPLFVELCTTVFEKTSQVENVSMKSIIIDMLGNIEILMDVRPGFTLEDVIEIILKVIQKDKIDCVEETRKNWRGLLKKVDQILEFGEDIDIAKGGDDEGIARGLAENPFGTVNLEEYTGNLWDPDQIIRDRRESRKRLGLGNGGEDEKPN